MASRWTGSLPLTMSSREIADLVECRHDSVKRAIERCAERRAITLPPLVEVSNAGPGPLKVEVYQLDKRSSMIVVAQLSPEFTARLVDRWQELEAKQGPKLPTTMAESWCAQHSIRLPICLHGLPFGDVNLLVSPRR